MTAIFYAIGDFCTFLFKFLPPIGMLVDILFMLIGTAMIVGWIRYMIKNENDKGWNIDSHINDHRLL